MKKQLANRLNALRVGAGLATLGAAQFALAVDPDFTGIETAANAVLALVATSLIAVMAVKITPIAVKWALGKIQSMLGR